MSDPPSRLDEIRAEVERARDAHAGFAADTERARGYRIALSHLLPRANELLEIVARQAEQIEALLHPVPGGAGLAQQVSAALADACHAGGLSTAYYQGAERALRLMVHRHRELLRWLRQTVHQAHHEGPARECQANTCAAITQELGDG